jgi:biopolymer transport protein ExbD
VPDGRIRPHYRPRRGFDHGRPIALLPNAPIVSVLLVAAVLLFSTWGKIEHMTLVDLTALPTWPQARVGDWPSNRITLSRDDAITWNGEPISAVELPARLAAASDDGREPILILSTDGDASYGAVARTVNLIRLAGMLDALCFAGLEQHGTFSKPYGLPANRYPHAEALLPIPPPRRCA